ncbi:MAG TPA: C4-type zinc ribbon domain-containing protein [Kofleriaceae bacterium]|nr:C4-type zinc ribbon domain-containing protein [Kofleriaceae bacterium]
MREQLVLLLQLQHSDGKVRELQSAVTQLPAKLDPLRRDLAKLQGMLDGERSKLNETNSWRKAQQELIDREREALRQAQGKFQASKNTKEFNASSREVENKRKAIGDREGELKKVNEAAAQSSTQLDARTKDVDVLRAELAASEAAMSGQLNALKAELAEATAVRDAARVQVETQWVKIYDSLAAKKGYAVAPVVKGVCQGCHMALPPQLANMLARMVSIETCPRCGRLIYRKELIEPEPAPEAKAEAEPAAKAEPKRSKSGAKGSRAKAEKKPEARAEVPADAASEAPPEAEPPSDAEAGPEASPDAEPGFPT